MYAQRDVVTVATNASGAGVGYSAVLTGAICQIAYVKTDYENGVTFAVTIEATGETVWSQASVNASASVAPRTATHTTAGVAAVYIASGQGVLDRIRLANDRLVFTITSAGSSAHTGAFHILLGD